MEQALTDLFAKIKPSKVIETGTMLGTGTTTILHSAVVTNKLDTTIHTIECGQTRYEQACHYFITNHFSWVRPWLGLSVPRFILPSPQEIRREFTDNEDTKNGAIYYDHQTDDRAGNYWNETNSAVTDDCLSKVLHCDSVPTSLFLLDSAGHIGQIEFHYLLGLLTKEANLATNPFYMVLHDTKHCKHYKTLEFIKASTNWTIVAEPVDRFGWAIIEVML